MFFEPRSCCAMVHVVSAPRHADHELALAQGRVGIPWHLSSLSFCLAEIECRLFTHHRTLTIFVVERAQASKPKLGKYKKGFMLESPQKARTPRNQITIVL